MSTDALTARRFWTSDLHTARVLCFAFGVSAAVALLERLFPSAAKNEGQRSAASTPG